MLKKRFFKTKGECEVSFELTAADASQVELFCESNGWRPIEMKKTRKGAKNGKGDPATFRAKVRLPQERRFQFRYLVDRSNWVNDEAADAYARNAFGTENGVLSTARAN